MEVILLVHKTNSVPYHSLLDIAACIQKKVEKIYQ